MSESEKSKVLSRRQFDVLLSAAGFASAAVAQEQNPAVNTQQPDSLRPAPGSWRRPLVPDTPALERPLEFRQNDVPARVVPFPMAQVRLLPNGVYHDSQEWNRGYMSRLDADRLLYTFRANAGLPVGSAKPLGGWEQPENGQRSSELRGHFAGHFLSASAQLTALGDKDT
jgi:hypothetical protein